ncbi:Mbov_0401 family ICE element transposase-like protein [Spiroplasma endosymbiont of Panzeria rudis]|uniref:Mbov_0401 family ICE element transposase-like protein n=1 Tax=Spiroplasma endosymbiont of Panzeria rudis TaxID=3066301 RepID=UPI0030D0390F
MLTLPFPNHFDWDKHDFNQDELSLKQTEELFTKIDEQLWNECDKSKYKSYRFRQRKLKEKKGLLTYKRRICTYYNPKTQKNEYVSLLDNYLGVKKNSKLAPNVIKQILKYFADDKKYRDVCDTFIEDLISNSTVCRIYQKFELPKANIPKIPLQPNQNLYVNIDDGHRKFWNFKRKGTKHSMRLIVTYTDNINHKVQNKRVKAIIRPTKTKIGVKKTAEFVKEHCQKFYENIEQAKIIICGDSAGWIKEVPDYLSTQFVLDKFHLIRTLYLGIMAGNKGKYLKEYNYCKNLINNGQYEKLIEYLYKELDNHKKLKKKYFKNNKQGIENQSAKWNIGCYTETNIWHVLKEMLGNRTYNILIYIKMVIFKCNKINTEIQLL